MFQSFTGSSRRPRQVNLSGQVLDPFAASSWAPDALGAKNTVKNAQKERLQRQQERDRLNAAKTIQRTWRGHQSRKSLASQRRREWDELHIAIRGTEVSPKLAEELRLLLSFFDSHNPQDVSRLDQISLQLLDPAVENVLNSEGLQDLVPKLAATALAALENSSKPGNLLQLLSTIIDAQPEVIASVAVSYYKTMATMLRLEKVRSDNESAFVRAVRNPLAACDNVSHPTLKETYKAFGYHFLSSRWMTESLVASLAEVIDIGLLSHDLSEETSYSRSSLDTEDRLWLLAHLIALHRLCRGHVDEAPYMQALSNLLSLCASEIVGRVDIDETDLLMQESDGGDDGIGHMASPLPKFVKEQLVTLVNKDSINGLLAKFNTDSGIVSATGLDGDSTSLASYVLVLLRIFPRLGEDIRLWLYQGSVSVTGSKMTIPAVKLFWRAMSTTRTFTAISSDAHSTLAILRVGARDSSINGTMDAQNKDWRAILLFLELYAFVLRFTDDEEFLNGGASSIEDSDQSISRSRESALPLHDVKSLTIFLKNLSFIMFYHAAELSHPEQRSSMENGLGSYFSSEAKARFTIATKKTIESNKRIVKQDFLGIAGMTFDYVRSIVTRVMRMLYERDSRRRFLPAGHWLMTSRFDMEGFIPAVVAEEERRHQITEEEEDAEDDEERENNQQSSGIIGNSRTRAQVRWESMRRQQHKITRRNMLAAIGPRLEILQNMPFAIPFETRVQIFRQFVYQDQLRRRGGTVDPDHWRMSVMHGAGLDRRSGRDPLSRHHAKIRREFLFEDAFDQFYELGEGLKEPIQITFVDQFDTVEAGIDGGGVTKEFLTSITKEAFKTTAGKSLFVTNDQNLLYPNPVILDERRDFLRETGIPESDPDFQDAMNDLLRRYEFLGRVVGKCLYEGILVDISFAGFFLLKWASNGSGMTSQDAGYLANINDLRDLDESLYQGLLKLKNYSGDVEDFSVDFTVTDTISSPGEPTRTATRDLIPNGANIAVSNENRMMYVSLVARHKLHRQPVRQTRAFLRGLGEIITPTWLSMFNQAELQTLIGGDSSEIDVEDLRRNTQYSGVYQIGDDGLEHPTVQIFWEVMKNLDDTDRRKVLKYVTSTPRAPLLGFSQLNPRFSIRDAGGDEQRLPSTSTCINLMKLPRYSTSELLKQKLLYAVNSGAGFDLS